MKNVLIMLSIVLFSFSSFAQKDFTSKKIAVFKNGTGFFIKSGQINAENGKYILPETPEALFGTIWVNSITERITSLTSLSEKVGVKKDATSIYELLSGNEGKKVKLIPFSGEPVEAIIESVKPMLLNFKTKDSWYATTPDQLKSVMFLEKPNSQIEEKTNKNSLMLTFPSAGNKNIDLMYLQKGISWMPEYLIELTDDRNATVQLKATLINDAEDLVNTDISFVVGVPNFKYSHALSPLTSVESLQSFLTSISGYTGSGGQTRFDNNMSNGIMAQSNNSFDYDATPTADYEYVAEGTNNEDLFFYQQSKVNLKKGERTSLELLYAKIAFEHIYEVDLPQNHNSYFYGKASYEDNKQNSVWHSIKLINNTKVPWTTGTALVIKKENNTISPISQDMMKYTPNGSESFLKITISPDINVKDKEIEVSRQPKAKKQGTQYYDLVSVEGKIKVKNFKDKEIKLNIKRNIFGELKDSDSEWKHVKNVANYYSGSINTSNSVDWTITLKPNEEKTITYSYSFWAYGS